MAGSPLWELAQAIYARLSADAALTTTLGADVYDYVPEGADFPYVVIGDTTEAPEDTMGQTGRAVTFTVHYWSRYRGDKEVYQMHNRVDELLEGWQPSGLTGWTSVIMQHEFFDSFKDPDGITRHGVARYRAAHVHQ